jgi:hypothetical protein
MNNYLDLKVFDFFNHNFHIFRSQEKMLLGIFCSHEKVLPVCLRNVKFTGIKKIITIFGQMKRILLFSPEHSAWALYSRPLKILPILLEKTEIFIHLTGRFI